MYTYTHDNTPSLSLSLFQTLSGIKAKVSEKKRQWDEEMEELKSQYEGEIQSLKNRYRKEKTSSDSAISDQLNQLEQELNEQWRVKSERMVQQTEERWKRKNQDLEVEKQIMSAISAMHSDVSSLTHSFPPFIS